MPELPEVETIRRDLTKKIVGKKIISVEVKDKKLGETKNFSRVLVGNKISAAERIGKLLILKLAGGKFLLIHLKMTGQLVYEDREKLLAGGHQFINNSLLKRGVAAPRGRGVFLEEIGGKLPNKYTRFILNFAGGRKLFFNDTRRFGYVKIVDQKELAEIKNKYGIEPLKPEFTLANLKKILAGKKINIKAALMDQQNIAGIGNIYASEILYAARVKPTRPAGSLTAPEVAKIYQATKAVLRNAIKHRGTTFSDYVDTSGKKGNFSKLLKVYEREGEKCSVCGGTIKSLKISGRGAYYCPFCQK
ncbi:MAG: bifunctional DNA-formamidopyrimidine glycosylase/DNA-(apurinic or apyrimidinic site) lyase [Patescibacteria group bacterium]|nr:bifunctional DNA-formamidopyrimidine glycosylase/DNA-(apurinic or apyrimidinic site) lyase [Patescibacteria group bacterium]